MPNHFRDAFFDVGLLSDQVLKRQVAYQFLLLGEQPQLPQDFYCSLPYSQVALKRIIPISTENALRAKRPCSPGRRTKRDQGSTERSHSPYLIFVYDPHTSGCRPLHVYHTPTPVITPTLSTQVRSSRGALSLTRAELKKKYRKRVRRGGIKRRDRRLRAIAKKLEDELARKSADKTPDTPVEMPDIPVETSDIPVEAPDLPVEAPNLPEPEVITLTVSDDVTSRDNVELALR
ncbi:hypothetical protein WH47_12655 [Habropoda laboriosa]|uniref:Uncharacterized protein n=1 Tax=Habropoda laboriosa TaxID=597456 RepID=A0A0L7QKB9_9HYME|nr:hypothetical protein WH47_12655 [Habropoda laboriosa]